jgi:hemoglobin/transferrin/lactoferrin receptor protein
VQLNARLTDRTFFPFPFSEAEQTNLAPSGNLGLVYNLARRWRIALSGATGFRAPNVDDLARVFESAGSAQLVVPNPDIEPEFTYNADLSVTYTTPDGVLRAEGTGFYTHFDNAIQLAPFTLNGNSSVVYNGVLTPVVANQNGARAYLYGAQGSVTLRMAPGFTLYSTLTHTFGRYTTTAGAEVPLDHVPPTFGRTSLMHTGGRFTGEVFTLYNAWKRVQEYNPFGEDNLVYATRDGMPAWWTLNARMGANINKYAAVQVALENILDKNYRAFASGISAPGRNLVVTLRGRF